MRLISNLVILLSAFLLVACEPKDRRPGTWISGEVVKTSMKDWSFANDHPEVFIQTHPWYGVPHSVTVVIASNGEQLFMPSIYFQEPKTFPEGKYWNGIVAKNPDVEVKIGDKVYPRTIRLIEDETEFALALDTLAAKYPTWNDIKEKPEQAPVYVLFSLDERQ